MLGIFNLKPNVSDTKLSTKNEPEADNSFTRIFNKQKENVSIKPKYHDNLTSEGKNNEKISSKPRKEKQELTKKENTNDNKETKDIDNTKDINSQKNEAKKTEEVDKPSESTEVTEEDKDIKNTKDKIINELALLFGVTEEKIKDTITKMDIDIDSLKDKNIMVDFTKEIYGLESNAELLNIPEIKNILEDASKIVKNMEVITNTEQLSQEEKQIINTFMKNNEKTPNLENEEFISTEEELSQNSEEIIIEDVNFDENIFKDTNNSKEKNQDAFQNETDNDFIIDTKNVVINNKEVNFEKTVETKMNINNTARTTFEKNIISQLTNNMKVEIKSNISTVRVTLHPETLGDVTLKISTQNGIVSAQFVAENERVKEVIQSNFNQLKSVLEEQGIQVSSLSVSVSTGKQEDYNAHTYNQGQKSNKRISNIIDSEMVINDEYIEDNYVLDILDASVNYMA